MSNVRCESCVISAKEFNHLFLCRFILSRFQFYFLYDHVVNYSKPEPVNWHSRPMKMYCFTISHIRTRVGPILCLDM